jgi:hypothetical protein
MGNCTNCLNQIGKVNKTRDLFVDEIPDKIDIDLNDKKPIESNNENEPLSTLKMNIYKDKEKDNKTPQAKNSSFLPNHIKSKKK